MTVLIDNRSLWEMPLAYESLIKKVLLKGLEEEGFETNCEISLSLVTPSEIRQINKQFRNIDKETDVLSFPLLTFEEGERVERNENNEIMLGDIIISVERAIQQAEDYGHTLEREIAFLVAHSLLHLLGYDHMEEEEEKVMVDKQKQILNSLDVKR